MPRPAPAWDFSLLDRELTLDLTNTTGYTYRFKSDNNDPSDDQYHHVYDMLDLSLSHGELRVGGQLILNLFASSPCVGDPNPCVGELENPDLIHNDNFAAQRLFLIWARPEFDLTLGDFYVSLGKGMAINVVKIDDLGQDTTIQGGKFVLHQGNLGLTFFGGEFNPLEVDVATGMSEPWTTEPVLGGRLEYNLFEKVLVGTHAVYIIRDQGQSFAGTDNWATDHESIWGVGLDIPDLIDGMLGLSGELDLQRSVIDGEVRRGPDGVGDDLKGVAAYASATFQIGDLSLLGEFKYYDDFSLKNDSATQPYILFYHQPPTLERIAAEIKDNTTVSGGRVRLDYNVGEVGPLELSVFANYGYFNNWYAGKDLRIQTPFGGIELFWSDGVGHLQVESGLRQVDDQQEDELAYRDIHVELAVEQALLSRHSISLSGTLLEREDYTNAFVDRNWKEVDAALGYKWSPHLQLSLTYEYQNDEQFSQQNYFGGEARYFFNPSSHVTLRVGDNRPSIKCVNGVCRFIPAFSGVKLTGVVRF